MLPEDEWERSLRAVGSADVFFSIGTSGVVYPAASIPHIARQRGAVVVEINPEPTPLTDHADYFLRGRSGVILPGLYERLLLERRQQQP
jgi:NAD-dependent deacetylase